MSLRPGGTREWLLTTGLPARPRASLPDARGNEVAPPAPSDESLGYSRVVPPGHDPRDVQKEAKSQRNLMKNGPDFGILDPCRDGDWPAGACVATV